MPDMTDAQRRAAKCATTKARHIAAKAERIKKMNSRLKRTPQEQLARLNAAGHTAKKERKKLAERVDKAAKA